MSVGRKSRLDLARSSASGIFRHLKVQLLSSFFWLLAAFYGLWVIGLKASVFAGCWPPSVPGHMDFLTNRMACFINLYKLRKKQYQKTEVIISRKIIIEVAFPHFYHFCPILFITCKYLDPSPHLRGGHYTVAGKPEGKIFGNYVR